MGIYFDGMLYHASWKRGVAKQKLEEYLAEKNEVFIYCYPVIDAEILPIFDIVPMKLTPIKFEVMKAGYGGNIY